MSDQRRQPAESPGVPQGPRRFAEVDQQRASTLLRLGLTGPRRGVDDVIDRLRAGDGAAWLDSALALLPARTPDEAGEQLVSGRASLPVLREAKERHKTAMLGGGSPDARVRSILLYFLCIAAALTHYGARITTQPQGELVEALLDLGAVLPEPWSMLAARAASRL